MALVIEYVNLLELSKVKNALETIEDLRKITPVEVVSIETEENTVKLTLKVPNKHVNLAKEKFPNAVVVA
ncbi:hypothetical protein [Palaeococcus ferrophilus]|uniref:hypothetical protein n=1 Tax=Palaeococcus ferrophilus TaxID=83868 RepID=UPI00064E5D6A|nr:hypothetical protein [Palaeococcus ferrophilus]